MNKLTYIVLVNYNSYKDTLECIESFKKSLTQDYCIFIVDNKSTDDSIAKIKSNLKNESFIDINDDESIEDFRKYKYILIKSKDNKGFASGNNKALRRIIDHNLDGYVWVLNNDTIIRNDSLVNLKNDIEENMFLGAVLVDYENKSRVQTIGGFLLKDIIGTPIKIGKGININQINEFKFKDPETLSGASIFMTTNTLRKVGLIPEEYFMYWEDTDWCFNAKNNDICLKTCLNAIVFHKEGASIGYKSNKQYILDFSNTLRFYTKYNEKYVKYIKYTKLMINVISAIKNKQNVIGVIKASRDGIIEFKRKRY